MGRLVNFGCSITFGEGLKDCQNIGPKASLNPSQFAWPVHLAKSLQKKPINLGYPGISNKLICQNLLNYQYISNDTVVILWTHFARTTFFTDTQQVINVQPTNKDNFKYYDKQSKRVNAIFYRDMFFYNNQNIENYKDINFSKLYLDSKGIKNYHFTWQQLPFNNQLTPSWNVVDLHYINLFEENNIFLDYADDRAHPGIETQKHISNIMYNIIKA